MRAPTRSRLAPRLRAGVQAAVAAGFAVALAPGVAGAGAAPDVARALPATQLLPALVKAVGAGSLAAAAVVAVAAALTVAFGRAYCMALCPLGCAQDAAAFASGLRPGRRPYRFRKGGAALRNAVLAACAASAAAGSSLLVMLLDPYSLFARTVRALLEPAAWASLTAARAAGDLTGLWNSPAMDLDADPVALGFSAVVLLAVAVAAGFRGRLFCDGLCPVGAALGWLSRLPGLRMRLDPARCVRCGACERVCRASCIDAREARLDSSRCTLCLECRPACPEGAISYGPPPPRHARPGSRDAAADPKPAGAIRVGRGEFLAAGAGAGMALAAASLPRRELGIVVLNGMRREAAMPPGAGSAARFSAACVSCQLCAARCPTGVLRPSGLLRGPRRSLQPFMDYSRAYCLYDCVECGAVCPSGAIARLSVPAKRRVKIGESRLLLPRCIVVEKNTPCGACAERCPTGAVSMTEPADGSLPLPWLRSGICIGCGACESACPAVPFKAIWTDGLAEQRTAEEPVKSGADAKPDGGFPF